jgi:hypothetical protein
MSQSIQTWIIHDGSNCQGSWRIVIFHPSMSSPLSDSVDGHDYGSVDGIIVLHPHCRSFGLFPPGEANAIVI